jgi:hypothetical protein
MTAFGDMAETPRARLNRPPYPSFDTFGEGCLWQIRFGSRSNAKTMAGGSVRLPTYPRARLRGDGR